MAAQNAIKSRRSIGKQGSKSGEPTSSLIATHLAPHLAPGADREYGIDRETFSQLRQEILGHEEDGAAELDDNVEDIHNLICVVVKAGLEPSLKPRKLGASREDLVGQALDCLDIIRLAIQRAPNVLYETSNQEVLGKDAAQLPLFAWLVPQLLSLFCSWDEKNLQELVCQIISTMYAAQFKAIPLWYSVKSISRFLRACIAG